ncbi:Gmad2 immunoglobulin-like domain-containing protein [Pseudonocardia hydrocarbonoxydans]|uniref:Gmad2 immunoglobulin-like domain-containing protein n=1 Tax=Pseudonocardia hydrocarbonoxydans TaxID=76726 RepID=UPI001477235D|nr:Gmad2 immunoglobulin-like domain-containing protein [Pseudonocardia hydrocarbonoxydans]
MDEEVGAVRWIVALVVVLLMAGCSGPAPVPAGPGPAPAPTPGPTATGRALPVYYVAETAAGPRLFREFHRVETADPASDAVREMFAGAVDPDYRTLWPSGTSLRAPVEAAGGVITVDLAGVTPGAQVGSAGAELTVQQLVYTVQGALQSTDPVRILLDGEPVEELFGAVSTADPVRRADQYATRSLVQIDAPADGAVVSGPVEVTGEAAVFEATVPWVVLRDGAVVQEGFTSTAEGQVFAPFSFTVELEPGEYVVRITEDDPSGGEGRPVLTDDKAITVTG